MLLPRPLVALALALALVPPARAEAEESVFRLLFDPAAPDVIHVEATVPVGRGRLSIGGGRPAPEEAGFRTFVDDLRIDDADGERVLFNRSGKDGWRLASPLPERVRLRYRVRLGHERANWPGTPAESGFTREHSRYFRGFAVFVVSDAVRDSRVIVNAPSGWSVSTALAPDPELRREYLGANRRATLEAGFLVGEHLVERVDAGGIELELALTRELEGAARPIGELLAAGLDAGVELFGSAPSDRYVVIATRHPDRTMTAGAGYPGGMTVMLGRHPEDDPGGSWAHTVLHELLHMWNGVAVPVAVEGAWFAEGVTDYLTLALGGRLGLVDDDWRLGYLARRWDGYERAAGEGSLATAGQDKLGAYDLVYGGGLFVGMTLDLAIRDATGGERSLVDLLRAIWSEFGDGRKLLTSRAVERLAGEVAGVELDALFDRHVFGSEALEAAEVLGSIGLRRRTASVGVTWRLDPSASDETVALRRELLAIG